MLTAAIIAVSTCVLLILSVIFLPKVRLFRVTVDTYWIICLIGAIVSIASGCISLDAVWSGMTANSAVNPLKILVLFVSMTFLSVFLDELGFFKHIAIIATHKSKGSQLSLFFLIYAIVSVLTVFTSNDVVILTFTPFICYFAKHTKINPVPYLVAEFCAANTWSMMLIIGNPTNVYLGTGAGIDFISYLGVMALPTLMGGAVQLLLLFLIFKRKLSAPLCAEPFESTLRDKPGVVVGLVHLALCLILLVVSSYVNVEMWLICMLCALSLIVCTSFLSAKRRSRPDALFRTASRLPWALIPFVLSMFVLVLSLKSQGITTILADFLGTESPVFAYGISSFIACNLMNNIPMSVLFSAIPALSNPTFFLKATYATIIGSNVGAFLTPIGALAGIMFTDLITMRKVKFSFLDFIRYGAVIALPTLAATLLGLELIL